MGLKEPAKVGCGYAGHLCEIVEAQRTIDVRNHDRLNLFHQLSAAGLRLRFARLRSTAETMEPVIAKQAHAQAIEQNVSHWTHGA